MVARQENIYERYNSNCRSYRLGTRSVRLCGNTPEFKAAGNRGDEGS